jgi:hypothetical protein
VKARGLTQDLLASVSLGILLFSANVSAWTSAANAYYLRQDRQDALLACLTAMLLAALATYGLLRLARKTPSLKTPLTWLALPVVLFTLNRLRASTGLPFPPGPAPKLIAGILLALLLYQTAKSPALVGRRLHLVVRWSAAFALMVLGTLAQSLFFGPAIDPETQGGPATTKPLILWAVFDELDQGWLFDHRPPELKLPNFDRLAAQSLTGSKVERPGPETLVSIPALTIGKPVKQSVIASSRDLDLTLTNGTHERWSEADTIFSTMKKRGRTIAIDGFYHNYPGVFRNQIPQIKTTTYLVSGFWPMLEENLWLLLPGELRLKGQAMLGNASLLNVVGPEQHRTLADSQLANLTQILQTRSADFVFFHCRLPHRPWLQNDYFGNLKAADSLLGQVIKSLEAQNRWNETTLLLTSDHNLRESLRGTPRNTLVPFILKLPNQRYPLQTNAPIQATNQRALLEAIDSHQIQSPNQAAQLLTR